MYGLGVNRLGNQNTADPIASLFSSGAEGVWYDPSDLSTMFQTSDGTTPAVVDSPVGYIRDKSGNGNHAIQATSTKRPVLAVENGRYYLDFDGTDDTLQNAAIDFSSKDSISVFTAVTKTGTGDNQNVLELSANVGSNNGAFRLLCTSGELWRFIAKGTSSITLSSDAVSDPDTSVLSGNADISSPVTTFRRNGTQEATTTNTLGDGNFGNYVLNVGSRSGNAAYLNGRVYGVVITDENLSTSQTVTVEAYLARKSGVTI